MKKILRNIWIAVQTAWDMKWNLFEFFVLTFMALSGLIVIIKVGLIIGHFVEYTFTNPEVIGRFFGKIVKGYKIIN